MSFADLLVPFSSTYFTTYRPAAKLLIFRFIVFWLTKVSFKTDFPVKLIISIDPFCSVGNSTVNTLLAGLGYTFKFDFDLESPEMMYLVINRGVTNSIDNSLPVFVESGTIDVNTELKYFYANAKSQGPKIMNYTVNFKK